MLVRLRQNTAPWVEWRNTGLGGSDANIIWSSNEPEIERLIFEKAGLKDDEDIPAFAKNIGEKYEPLIRKHVEEQTGLALPAQCYSHNQVDWMHASADGGCADVLLEAKASGEQLYEQTAMGVVPHIHLAQMLHNMMCADARVCIYAVCNIHTNEVATQELFLADYPEEAAMLLLAEHAVWDAIQSVRAPYDLGSMPAEQMWIAGKAIEAKAKKVLADAREQLLEVIGSRAKGQVGRVKFSKTVTKGRVDYGALANDAGLSLDDYRKEPTESMRFTIGKEES